MYQFRFDSVLAVGFNQLQKVFASINKSDMNKIQTEVKELIQGEQNFLEYAKDVSALLVEIRNRTDTDGEVGQKIIQNIPEQHKEEGVGNFFENFTNVLDEVRSLTEKALTK